MNADLKAYPEYQEVGSPRTLEDFNAVIPAIEQESDGLLDEIIRKASI